MKNGTWEGTNSNARGEHHREGPSSGLKSPRPQSTALNGTVPIVLCACALEAFHCVQVMSMARRINFKSWSIR